jgi:two-component system, cell cycle sensor histidine kinase and response regulator CckA
MKKQPSIRQPHSEAPTGATENAPPERAAVPQSIWADVRPIPEVPLIDRRVDRERRRAAPPVLNPLPQRRTVMIVDDEPMMREVLLRILQKENYELVVADSGAAALHLALECQGRIDLLVTDYAMPEMRGRELADKLRVQIPKLPVLYQTGFSDMLFDQRPELEEGAAFLEKPFTPRGLLEAVRFMLFGTMNPAAASAK